MFENDRAGKRFQNKAKKLRQRAERNGELTGRERSELERNRGRAQKAFANAEDETVSYNDWD